MKSFIGKLLRAMGLAKKAPLPLLSLKKRVCYHDNNVLVVEYSPHRRTIFVDSKPVYCYFPYTYFVIEYFKETKKIKKKQKSFYSSIGLKVGFAGNYPVTSSLSLHMLPLPNYLGNFDVCLGDLDISKSFDTLKEAANYIIDSYWKSSFEIGPGVDYKQFKKFLSLGKEANPHIYDFQPFVL